MTDSDPLRPEDEELTLVELVNRVVDRGVVLSGEVTISVANVDLLFLGVRLLLCSTERVGLLGRGRGVELLAEGGGSL
jgi:hypothetical protein